VQPRRYRQQGEKDGDSMTSFVMESFTNDDGQVFQEQRYTARSWRRLLQCPVVEIDNKVHGYIICDRAMKVRMLHCELKWEIPNSITTIRKEDTVEFNI